MSPFQRGTSNSFRYDVWSFFSVYWLSILLFCDIWDQPIWWKEQGMLMLPMGANKTLKIRKWKCYLVSTSILNKNWGIKDKSRAERAGQQDEEEGGESGNVLMLHMVTSDPSPGLTSSSNTKARHGLANIVCFAKQQVSHGLPETPQTCDFFGAGAKVKSSNSNSCLKLWACKLLNWCPSNFSANPNTNLGGTWSWEVDDQQPHSW